MSDVDLQSLRLLLALQESPSIASAAAAVGITQPAASARLRALERRWALPLATRTHAGTALTDAGTAVCGWARAVFEELSHLDAGASALGLDRAHDVRIAASMTVAEHLLPSIISAMRITDPKVSIGLSIFNSQRVADAITNSEADLGFIETPLKQYVVESKVLGSDAMLLVVSPGHRWATSQRPIEPAEIRSEPMVLRELGSGSRQTLEDAVGQMQNVVLEFESTSAIIGAVSSGAGAAVVSARAVSLHLKTGALVRVPTAVKLTRPIRALWRSDSPPSRAANQIVQQIEASLRVPTSRSQFAWRA